MSYPSVAMAAVVGTPDPTFVEIVTAVIVLKDPSQPFDGAGKILKNKLREMLHIDRLGRTQAKL